MATLGVGKKKRSRVASRAHSRNEDLFTIDRVLAKSNLAERNTKVICTLGPACWEEEQIEQLLENGMNIARFNFSHGSHESHGDVLQRIRNVLERRPDLNCGIMLDTKGPEIRTGFLKDHKPVTYEAGIELKISTDYSLEGDETFFTCSYADLPTSVHVGNKILVADGSLVCEVLEKLSDGVKVKTLNSYTLGERKNMNLPGVKVTLPTVTDKDIEDILNFGIKNNVDMIAASFIRKESDIMYLRQLLGEQGKKMKIIAKIENQEGLENYEKILEATDAVMVARGDLGMEIPPEKVFVAQKMMIHLANLAGKPIITATQMLESMGKNPRPTRAEASDVANAVLDGTDCVMLSGETANGDYPLEAVNMMARICVEAESVFDNDDMYLKIRTETMIPMSTAEAIASGAVKTSLDMKVRCILVVTESGRTARLLAKYRPKQRILALTFDKTVANNLELSRGVTVFRADHQMVGDNHAAVRYAIEHGIERGFMKKGERIICVYGTSEGVPGSSNLMKILPVE
eukprot:CAMPEP_0114995960 /NCGR_PEP_ID=MMETSP0216-20121206/14033_1 /TAXON_ID=223996 /ORGANISM="Protocruzia adherens, Strain Boccale" /LENGTH=517 /DNA_ID=CAMNT_0002360087 /DNA_START=39 /DNA_END=1592 /DNA_ORIENTATION=+